MGAPSGEAQLNSGATWAPPPVFDGYKLLGPLGEGGMGQVFLARDVLLEREVAIKFPRSSEPNARRRSRFLFEGKALARLTHPNIVLPFKLGEVEGAPYLVSEFVAGKSLDRLETPVDATLAFRIALGLARALAATHQVGIVHRDVKPANVMVSSSGEVKLIDFGIARLFDGQVQSAARAGISVTTETDGESASVAEDASEGVVLGTTKYMAPERQAGAPATVQSDLFSLGRTMLDLLTGHSMDEAALPDSSLSGVVRRCLAPNPVDRFRSADELLNALEELDDPDALTAIPSKGPYPGLASFGEDHRGVFRGRREEVRSVLEMLERERLVVLSGDSGVGKSSLCAASVIPRLSGPKLAVVPMTPGTEPLSRLAHGLGAHLSLPPQSVIERLLNPSIENLRTLWAPLEERRLLVFVDQLEELLTLCPREEAERFCKALTALFRASPRTRLLCGLRGDFVSRAVELPHFGSDLQSGLFFVRPIVAEQLREAIVAPAFRAGFTIEPEAVSALMRAAKSTESSLPLVQFTLEQLWQRRDVEKRSIPFSALTALGGVEGALERHANACIDSLATDDEARARWLLCKLVTPNSTRARLSGDEITRLSAQDRRVLEHLIQARLIVAQSSGESSSYELTHEALIKHWSRLRNWLAEGAARRVMLERLNAATAEWKRLGRTSRGTWQQAQLAEVASLDSADLDGDATAFVAASRTAVRRTRATRLGVAVLAVLIPTATFAVASLDARRQLRREAEKQHASAAGFQATARDASARGKALREKALGQFDAAESPSLPQPSWGEAELTWAQVLVADAQAESAFKSADLALETAALIDRDEAFLKERVVLLLDELELAQRMHRPTLVGQIRERLTALNGLLKIQGPDATRGFISLEAPEGVQLVRLEPVDDGGLGLKEVDAGVGPELPAGSYLARSPGVQRPFEVIEGERVRVPQVPARVPAGFVGIPTDTVLLGSNDVETLRKAFGAPPLHRVAVAAYAIAQKEVTFQQYIEWLDTLGESERKKRTPGQDSPEGALELKKEKGVWSLMLKPTVEESRAVWGELLHLSGRKTRSDQDWRQFPVSAISIGDARAYAKWLSETGRVPGARLCTDREWERAARGADARLYTTGSDLNPADANIDTTYERTGYGPDVVGSHPQSVSPWGLQDMQGNASEMVTSSRANQQAATVGGSWYYDVVAARLDNRFPLGPDTRSVVMGFRLCADLK